MSELIVILQVIFVGLVSFAVFAFLLSHLRYRKLQLMAMDHAGDALSPSEAVVLILQELRQGKAEQGIGCIRLECIGNKKSIALLKELEGIFRKDDRLFLLQTGVVIAVVKCPLENLPAVAGRLRSYLKTSVYSVGSISMWRPEMETQAIFNWLQKGENRSPKSGWEIYPAIWEFVAPEIPPSPAVDTLTGVLTSDRVSRALRRMLAVHRRVGLPTTLIRLDIDQLDSYNKAHGREAGDMLLKQAADLLMQNCRETDLIGRLQDDEFVIAMQGEDDSILEAVQRMSDLLKQTMISFGDEQIRFSIGSGLASMPKDGRNPMQLLQKAGWAMAEAKKRGRGVCVAYQPGMEPAESRVTSQTQPTDSF